MERSRILAKSRGLEVPNSVGRQGKVMRWGSRTCGRGIIGTLALRYGICGGYLCTCAKVNANAPLYLFHFHVVVIVRVGVVGRFGFQSLHQMKVGHRH